MLLRGAARIIRGGPSTLTLKVAARPQWCRNYAKDDRPHRAPSKPPPYVKSADDVAPDRDATASGPVRNQTWSPDKPIRFVLPQEPQRNETILEDDLLPGAPVQSRNEISDFSASREPISEEELMPAAGARTVIAPADVLTSHTEQPLKIRSAIDSPGVDSAPSLKHVASETNTGSVRPVGAEDISPVPEVHSKLREGPTTHAYGGEIPEPAATQQPPTGPLPDLRQGIPSTFASDFSDRSSSFKTKDSEPPELNLTEDPATGGGRRGGDDLPKEAYISSIERRRLALARYMYTTFAAFAVTGAIFLGQNWDEEEAKAHPDAPNGWDPVSFYARIKERLGSQLGYYTEPTFPKLLPDMDPTQRAPYTLVLSLEDLLVSSNWSRTKGWEVAKRPGVDYFIRYMSQYYELVIFTSVPMMNADLIIRKLDPFRLVMWPLFREATRYLNGEHVKDLSYLNRDLSKTLIVDTNPAHVQLQPENAVILPKWDGKKSSENTSDLVALIPFLEYIAGMGIQDVRAVLKSYEGTHIPTEFHRRETLAREAFQKRLAEEKAKRPTRAGGSSVLGGLSNALGFKPTQALMQIPGEQTPVEGFAQGKMLSDQMRERGLKNYEQLEREIRENGENWLKEMEREEKKAQEEQMKSMQSGMTGMFSGFFGGGSGEEKR